MKKFLILYMVIAFGCIQAGAPIGLEALGMRERDRDSNTSRRSYIGIVFGESCDECVQRVTCNGCGLCKEGSCCEPICCQPEVQRSDYGDLDRQN